MAQKKVISTIASQKRVVLICGMHRSGTSLMAHLLMDLGLSFGTRLLNEPVPDNFEGYGENADVVALEEALLDQLDRTWHSANGGLPLPADWLTWPETVTAEHRLREIVSKELEHTNSWAVKDPRASRLLPLWHKVLDGMGVALSVIVCTRNPDCVVQSLQKRNAMPNALAYDVFSQHYIDILKMMSIGVTPVYSVDYDDVVGNSHESVRAIVEHLALSVDPETIHHAAFRIKTDLRHHVALDSVASAPREFALKLYHCVRSQDVSTGLLTPSPSTVAECSVSIIMRTKDRLQFISRALRSVLGQTHGNWHIALVNDGGDGIALASVVQPYLAALRGRLTQIDLSVCRGMEAASNRGIRARDEDFIVIHDDDDSWTPEFLEACLRQLVTTAANAVVTRTTIIEEITDGSSIREIKRHIFRPEITSITISELFRGNIFPPISFVFRRTLFDAVGPYREDLPVLGDWDFNVRAAQHSTIEFLDRPLAYWHWRPSSDRHPNSDHTLHVRFDGIVRDRWLRDAGAASLAIGTAANSVLRSVEISRAQILHAAESVAQRVEQHITRLSVQNSASIVAITQSRQDQARQDQDRQWFPKISSGPSVTNWGVMPTGSFDVTGDAPVGEQHSIGIDPQLHYSLPEGLPPGRYSAECRLEVRSGTGPVELFYSSTAIHDQANSIVLQPLGDALYGGAFETCDAVQHVRIDPMCTPGEFRGGALTLRGMTARTSRLPDFLCIGAQHGGSDWLREALRVQPGIYLPPYAELHALDDMAGIDRDRWTKERLDFLDQAKSDVARDNWDRAAQSWRRFLWATRLATSEAFDQSWYQSLFSDAGEHQAIGDITSSYAALPERAIARAVAAMPNIQIFFLMRDPVEEAICSAYQKISQTVGDDSGSDVSEIIRNLDGNHRYSSCDYKVQIRRWERYVPATSIHPLMFDDIVDDPADVVSGICEKLGVAMGSGPLPVAPSREDCRLRTAFPAGIERTIALQYRDDLQWLANRFEGPARNWFARAEQRILSG